MRLSTILLLLYPLLSLIPWLILRKWFLSFTIWLNIVFISYSLLYFFHSCFFAFILVCFLLKLTVFISYSSEQLLKADEKTLQSTSSVLWSEYIFHYVQLTFSSCQSLLTPFSPEKKNNKSFSLFSLRCNSAFPRFFRIFFFFLSFFVGSLFIYCNSLFCWLMLF